MRRSNRVGLSQGCFVRYGHKANLTNNNLVNYVDSKLFWNPAFPICIFYQMPTAACSCIFFLNTGVIENDPQRETLN